MITYKKKGQVGVMANLVAFVNSFLSYFALFAFIIVLCVVAALVGIKIRKNKDLKDAQSVKATEQRSLLKYFIIS